MEWFFQTFIPFHKNYERVRLHWNEWWGPDDSQRRFINKFFKIYIELLADDRGQGRHIQEIKDCYLLFSILEITCNNNFIKSNPEMPSENAKEKNKVKTKSNEKLIWRYQLQGGTEVAQSAVLQNAQQILFSVT